MVERRIIAGAACNKILRMLKIAVLLFALGIVVNAVELPTKKYLNLAEIKTMVNAAEEEATRRNVQVTLCIVDENGTVIFMQKGDGVGINTLRFAERKARHAAHYRSPSKSAADSVKSGNLATLVMPEAFPNQGGVPIKLDGQTLGGIAASGAASEVDEAIAQAGVDALLK